VGETLNTSKEAKTAVDGLTIKVTHLENDYGAYKAGIGTTVAETVKMEIEKAMANLQLGTGRHDPDPDGEHPERLVVVSGWPEDTPANNIVERLKEFTTHNSLQEKVVEEFCFNDPAMSGVLKFKSETSRNAFLRGSWRLKNTEIEAERKMKFNKKLTVTERAAEKRLGYIKNEIMTTTGANVKEVKIHWKRHAVEYKKVTVFKVAKGGERTYDGVGKDVKKEVEAKVEKWLEKRMSEDSE